MLTTVDFRFRLWIIPVLVMLLSTFYPLRIDQEYKVSEKTLALLDSREIQVVTKDFNHVLYVISLDGKITAIDIRENGREIWVADTGSPLVNSTLSKIVISRNSKSIRLIPSLIGGIYEKSDGEEYMQPLPFDAESLLNTSSQLHEESIMTGGKETDTLGLDLETGKVVYSYSQDHQNQATCSTSMLIIKRIRQTVRARSAHNGYEQWVFSVSNHDLIYLYTPSSSSNEILEPIDYSVSFEYQLQTGVVLAFDQYHQLIWTSFIKSPIAAVWELKNGRLKEKSLFQTKFTRRLAFMGEFNSTPYVIISSQIQRQLISNARNAVSANIGRPSLSLWHQGNQQRLLSMSSESSEQNYPLVVRQKESLDMTGYLQLTNFNEPSMSNQRYFIWTMLVVCFGALMVILIWFSKWKQVEFLVQQPMVLENSVYQLLEPSFQSRYIIEYEHVRFLGRGGFGVVFEAINKLDQRRVAIKRVLLKKLSGKERALKEIRCLAILNHPNLIQYYYAWNECPPHGWQDEEDRNLIMKTNERTRDSISIPLTSAVSDEKNESINSAKLASLSNLSPLIDFTFERSLNPPPIHEDSSSSLLEHSYESSEEEAMSNPLNSLVENDCLAIYFYFVMELCQLESLHDRLIKQTIPQSQVWSIIDQIIQGIEYIHSQKLIHRDLKPSNILFSLDNTVKIGDFGLVSAFGEDKTDQTSNNELGGTMLYMSPEQINRQSYNQKVDIYAIGIILFELLYPFSTQMERIRALTNVRLQIPIFPSDFQCNQLICGLIRWLLAYAPHDRPKASELRQDNSYQNLLQTENFFS